MEKHAMQQDYVELDLRKVFEALLRRWWLIVAAAVIGGAATWYVNEYMLTPQYESIAIVYAQSKDLTYDFQVIITTRPVLQEVIDRLHLDMSPGKLAGRISVKNEEDTRVVIISVRDPDPKQAKRIVDRVAKTTSKALGDMADTEPCKIVENGEVASVPAAPSKRRNTLLGVIGGASLVCGIILQRMILKDAIQSEDDVEKHLGLRVLASVPEQESGKRKRRKWMKKE